MQIQRLAAPRGRQVRWCRKVHSVEDQVLNRILWLQQCQVLNVEPDATAQVVLEEADEEEEKEEEETDAQVQTSTGTL